MPEQKHCCLSRKKKITIAFVLCALIVGFLFAFIWFGATGGGEYKDSPDGRYTAHISLMSKRTLLDGEIRYIEMRIEEKTTGQTCWQLTYHPPKGSHPPLYPDRSQNFIHWDLGSTKVVFPLDTHGMQITVPVP